MSERIEHAPQEGEQLSLRNKTVLIFGASTGLGRAIVNSLASEQSNLFLLSRHIEEEPQEPSESIHRISCDVRDASSVAEAFRRVDTISPQIDYVINCAGIGLLKGIDQATSEEVQDVVQTDLIGAMFIGKEAYMRMSSQGAGRIIQVSSISGLVPRGQEPVYAAAKAGLRSFTESLREEAKSDGLEEVVITGVYPGRMNTPNFRRLDPSRPDSSFMDPSLVANAIVDCMKTADSRRASQDIVLPPGILRKL